jgi:hypothetical protein
MGEVKIQAGASVGSIELPPLVEVKFPPLGRFPQIEDFLHCR